jgi:hypothetical protein
MTDVVVITLDDALYELLAAMIGPLARFQPATITDSAWEAAPLIIIDNACANAVGLHDLPRRAHVVLVGTNEKDPAIWQRAVAVGAEHVVVLPDGQDWLQRKFDEVKTLTAEPVEWTVTFTKTVSARSYDEAVERADDGKGGGSWEAVLVTPPALALHDGSLTCPHCGDVTREVVEVDQAIRWNRAEVEVIGDILHLPYTTGQDDFEHQRYICGACSEPVSLPEGFTPDEDWT